MGFEVAQYRLLNLYVYPYVWFFWATLLFLSLMPALAAITWRIKTGISYTEPTWNLREREVMFTEYEEMTKEYQKAYRHVLSIIDYPSIFILIIVYIGAVLFPFVTMQTTTSIIAATPVVFGVLFVPFGILFANVLFRFIPNEATFYFTYPNQKQLRRIIDTMSKSPGISWAGIRVTLGEVEGYYTIRDPTPTARIEDIEGVSWIEFELGETGDLCKFVAYLQLGDGEESIVAEGSLQQLTSYFIAGIVKKILLAYINAKGEQELLADVLEEVESYLNRFRTPA